MALTTTGQVLQALNLYSVPQDDFQRYDLLRRMVEAAVKAYCKWPIEQATTVDYYDGTGYPELTLRQPFVSNVASVYQDIYGYAGQGANSFGPNTLLTAGKDYYLDYETPQFSKCARLVKISNLGIWFPSSYPFFNQAGGLAYTKGASWQVGQKNIQVTSTWGFPPAVALATPYVTWSGGVATFTTAAAHGFTQGMRCSIYGTGTGYDGTNYLVASAPTATTFTVAFLANQGTVMGGMTSGIPDDLAAATCSAVGLFRNMVLHGGVVTNESLGDYSYSITLQREPQFCDIRQLLGQYRDMPLAGI